MKRKIYKMMSTLREKCLTLALAESMTCGLVAHQLANIPGTTEVLRGGIVCYHSKVKTDLCHVPASLIEKYTAESQEVTDALAKNLSKLIKADIYLSVTGLAAPGGSETKDKPVGSIFLAVYHRGKMFRKDAILKGTPLEIKKKTCEMAFQLVYEVAMEKVNR